MTDHLVSSAVAARTLGVSRRSLTRWARDGVVVPAVVTPGGWLKWDLAELRRQLRKKGSGWVAGQAEAEAGRPEPQPVVAAVVTFEGRMLVTWRRDKSPPAGFLSGEIEPGESALDAMVREV